MLSHETVDQTNDSEPDMEMTFTANIFHVWKSTNTMSRRSCDLFGRIRCLRARRRCIPAGVPVGRRIVPGQRRKCGPNEGT